MSANVTFGQVGLPAGVLNEAREDGLDTGAVMSATVSGYVSTHRAELVWVGQHPSPDTTSVASFAPVGLNGYSWTPTASRYGTWLLHVVTDEGTADQDEVTLAFAIKSSPTALRIPAPQERGDPLASMVNSTPATKRASWYNKPESTGPFSGAGGTWAPWWRPHADMIHTFNTSGGAPVPSSRAINTTAPLAGGGNLSADRTLSITAATTIAAGSMSASDKTKLDSVASNAAALTASAPSSVGTANSVGVGTTAAKFDHVHDHGAQTSGTLHAVVTTSVNGFMSATDKVKLDAIANEVSYVTVSGTSKTLALSDAYTTQDCTNASPVTITVPTNASVAYNIGTVIAIVQDAAGKVTLAGPGVTLNSGGGELSTYRLYSEIFIQKQATNTWLVTGEKST